MTYLFQPARAELDAAIQKNAHYLQGRILDVGAGSYDRYSRYFTASEYVRMNVEPGTTTDLVGRAEAIPAADASFDSIVCTQVLGDVFDVAHALREFRRVVKKGGAILITEALVAGLHDEPHDYWRFTSHSLRKLCEDAGFVIEVCESLGGYFSVRADMHIRYLIETYDLYHAPFARLASQYFKLLGRVAAWRDAHSGRGVTKRYTNGWIIVARG